MNNEFLKTKKAFKYMQYSAKYFKGDIIILPIRCNKKINKSLSSNYLPKRNFIIFSSLFFLIFCVFFKYSSSTGTWPGAEGAVPS